MPTVSIVVPNYNHARFLRKRVDTIFAQTFQDFELILLDDASTDDSQSILREYASDPRARYEFNQANSGSPFKQWNKGVSLAQGKFVWIAESDDHAAPQFLERLVAVLESDPEIGFAYCRSWRTTSDDCIDGFADYNLPDSPRWASDFCVDGKEFCRKYFALIPPVPNASGVVFRKCLYEKIGGADESLQLCGDWKVWAAMSLASKVSYVSEPLNYFRYHTNNARSTTGRAGIAAKEFLDVSRWVLDRVTVSDRQLDQIREARAVAWVPVLLSRRTSAALRRELLNSVRAIDPHPLRHAFRPAVATIRRKIQRHLHDLHSAYEVKS